VISGKVVSFNQLYTDLEESQILLDLAIEESDPDTIEEASQQIQAIEKK